MLEELKEKVYKANMQLKEFGVSLGDLIHEFNFEVVYGPEGFEKTEITKDDVNRPGLQLAGFFDYFDPNRIQIMGKVESSYVEGLSSEERRSRFDRLFETGIPVLRIDDGQAVFLYSNGPRVEGTPLSM